MWNTLFTLIIYLHQFSRKITKSPVSLYMSYCKFAIKLGHTSTLPKHRSGYPPLTLQLEGHAEHTFRGRVMHLQPPPGSPEGGPLSCTSRRSRCNPAHQLTPLHFLSSWTLVFLTHTYGMVGSARMPWGDRPKLNLLAKPRKSHGCASGF